MGALFQDSSKKADFGTSNKGPVTLEQLAEVEANILTMLDTLSDKFSTQANGNTKEAKSNSDIKK